MLNGDVVAVPRRVAPSKNSTLDIVPFVVAADAVKVIFVPWLTEALFNGEEMLHETIEALVQEIKLLAGLLIQVFTCVPEGVVFVQLLPEQEPEFKAADDSPLSEKLQLHQLIFCFPSLLPLKISIQS